MLKVLILRHIGANSCIGILFAIIIGEMDEEAKAKKNRRASPRAPLRVGIDYSYEGVAGAGITRDISTGGVFIECRGCFDLGSMVEVSFQLPGSEEPIQAMIWVAWEKKGEGFGAQFLNLNDEARVEIEDYVTRALIRPRGSATQTLAGSA